VAGALPFTESDLDDIAGYIAQDNPRRAVTFIRKIRARLHEIEGNPRNGILRSQTLACAEVTPNRGATAYGIFQQARSPISTEGQ